MQNNKRPGPVNGLTGLAVVMAFSTTALAQTVPPTQTDATSTTSEETVEVLQRKLSAQQAINQQLRQRVDALERELSSERKTGAPLIVGLDMRAPIPVDEALNKSVSAIEEALGEKGLVLLPAGAFRLTPAMTWTHSTSGATRMDSYILGLSFEAGLPMGLAVSVRQPYIWRDYSDASNSGQGDFSLSLAKKLNNETATMPSFVASLGYTHDNGKDAFRFPSIGSGFRSFDLGLSGVKRFDPLVLYGNVSYSQASESFASLQYKNDPPYFTGKIKPGDSYGLGLGVSLAATPEVSVDTGLSLSWAGKTRFNEATDIKLGLRSTTGYFNIGARFLLSRNLSLSMSAAAGVTKNATDLVMSVALPYRF